MKIDDATIGRLRELAGKATPGPWMREVSVDPVEDNVRICRRVGEFAEEDVTPWMTCDTAQVEANHEFIAAANPQTVLALLAELADQRAENGRLMSVLGQAMNPPVPADTRADYIAAHLWLTKHGVAMLKDGRPATLAERAQMLMRIADERGERLERMEPLYTVLRSWDWAQVKADGQIDSDHGERQVIDAFAAVEKAELEAAKAKEASRG